GRTHVVRRGESLGTIARKNHVSISELRAWNRLKSDRVHAGQQLVVHPQRTVTAAASTPAAAPVAKEEERDSANEARATEYIYHTVQPGDTLWGIAQRYPGVTVDEIKRLNSGMDTRRLSVGKKIKVGVQKG
ncbi:MAG: LysM peptidoglycan-binding domain-containing protein, partial [Bacteroidetes bacterium]|nr:LysM peptidoglycan-binding domain-containing protein [Bacteroidota bacterium]